ncbi:MAG: hypothetical protein V3W26_00800 [Thermodesulfobacteriota bacterium]
MTQRYSHHCPESLRDGVEVLDGLRAGTSPNLGHSGNKELPEGGARPVSI